MAIVLSFFIAFVTATATTLSDLLKEISRSRRDSEQELKRVNGEIEKIYDSLQDPFVQ